MSPEAKPIHSWNEKIIPLEWFPFNLYCSGKPGSTTIIKNQAWSRYFDHIAGWSCTFWHGVQQFDVSIAPWAASKPKDAFALTLTNVPLALNRAGESIALQFTLQYTSIVTSIVCENSHVYLVPPPDHSRSNEALSCIFEDVIGLRLRTLEPSWAKEYIVPGLESLEAEIKRLSASLTDAQSQRAQVTRWLPLLYESGYALQDLCADAFKELGAQVQPSTISDEFMVYFDKKTMPVEVKGIGKSAAKKDVAQLVVDVGDNKFDNSCLLVNAWRELPPGQRDTKDKPWFPDDVIKSAHGNGIMLLSTMELLKCLVSHWERKTGKTTLQRMFSSQGVFKANP